MSRHDATVSLRDMLQYAQRAIRLAAGKSASELQDDESLDLAIPRALEIIGEAASRIPPSVREQYSTVPWRAAINLRNRLVHGYDTVDFEIVREILDDDLPLLIAELERILADWK